MATDNTLTNNVEWYLRWHHADDLNMLHFDGKFQGLVREAFDTLKESKRGAILDEFESTAPVELWFGLLKNVVAQHSKGYDWWLWTPYKAKPSGPVLYLRRAPDHNPWSIPGSAFDSITSGEVIVRPDAFVVVVPADVEWYGVTLPELEFNEFMPARDILANHLLQYLDDKIMLDAAASTTGLQAACPDDTPPPPPPPQPLPLAGLNVPEHDDTPEITPTNRRRQLRDAGVNQDRGTVRSKAMRDKIKELLETTRQSEVLVPANLSVNGEFVKSMILRETLIACYSDHRYGHQLHLELRGFVNTDEPFKEATEPWNGGNLNCGESGP
ncbi:MAG: hypothetical protein RhofKO_32060 [Rhodothermales bacterium]